MSQPLFPIDITGMVKDGHERCMVRARMQLHGRCKLPRVCMEEVWVCQRSAAAGQDDTGRLAALAPHHVTGSRLIQNSPVRSSQGYDSAQLIGKVLVTVMAARRRMRQE